MPFELQRRIAAFCEPATIASLARIHTYWTAACEEVLYEHVSMSNSGADQALARTVASNPRKAALVRAVDSPTHGLAEPFATAYCDMIPAMPNLRCLEVPVMDYKLRARMEALMRAGRLRSLHTLILQSAGGIRRPPRDVGGPRVLGDDGILSLHEHLRVLAIRGRPSVKDMQEYCAQYAARYSVITCSGIWAMGVYPEFYTGPRRARYLEDCTWALHAPVLRGAPTRAGLDVHVSIHDLSPVREVMHALSPHLLASITLRLFLVPPTQAPSPDDGLNGRLLAAPEIFAEVESVADRLSWLVLRCDNYRWVHLLAWAESDFGFIEQLVQCGCTALMSVQFFDGEWFSRKPGSATWRQWWAED